MPPVTPEQWKSLWNGVKYFGELFPHITFIGGIAVYCHAKSNPKTETLASFTHDGDFMIAAADFPDLRDIEYVTSNRRLNKHQTIKNDIEFDVYEQHTSKLVVPVEEVLAASQIKNGIRVACLEHLLAMKFDAYLDRKNSAKGEKDENDLCQILILMSDAEITPFRLKHINPDIVVAAKAIAKSDTPMRLANNNSHFARTLRLQIHLGLNNVEQALTSLAAHTQELPNEKSTKGKGRFD